MSYIRIEPHTQFKKAIHKVRKDGYITYNYWGMVDVCERLYDITKEDAREWVDYNILGLNDDKQGLFGVSYAKLKVRKVRKVRKVGKGVGKQRAR